MDIFESLENLNVSEECFNDIIESLYNTINQKYGNNPKKWEQLQTKLASASSKEHYASQNRDFGGKDKYAERELMDNKRYENKQTLGNLKTDLRRIKSHENSNKIIANGKKNATAQDLAQKALNKHADEKDAALN